MENSIEEIELRPSSVLRTSTLRANAARQVVNFMPSRQTGFNTVRLRRSNSSHRALLDMCEADAPDSSEKQADFIVRGMEQHHQLMEDNPVSEELRREALRDLPQGLTMKRNVRAKLSASVSLRSKRRPISVFKRMKYRISFAWKRMRDHFRDFVFSVELWYEAIRTIEGQLGSAVGAYFHLLRWLFTLNLLLSIFVIGFVVVPQALHDGTSNSTTELNAVDFITGEGGLTDSLLFYGHYHNDTINTVGSLNYYMPYAYFFTMVCLYLTFFAIVCYRSAYSYRRHFISPGGARDGVGQLLAAKLFCGWDFGVASPSAAALCSAALYREFKELLDEQNRKRGKESWCAKLCQRATRVAATVVVLAIIAATQYGLWLLLDMNMDDRIYISLAITALVVIFPIILNLVVKAERSSPRASLHVSLARTWLLHAATALLLLLHWSGAGRQCWETDVGQESYRLVVLDALVSLLLVPLVEVARGLMYKWKLCGRPQFDTAYNSVGLMYGQALVFWGLVFSPLLAPAACLKCLLLFYVKRETALRTCHPGRKVWRAAQTQTVLVSLVSLSLFLSLFALGSLYLTRSSACGALAGYRPASAALARVLRLHELPALRAVLRAVTRPGCIAFLLLALCACVYMMRGRARARARGVRVLRRLRRLHAADKEFLLQAIRKVADGEWLYSPKSEECGPDSHTWKYLQEVRKPSNAGYNFDASRLSHSFVDRPKSYIQENRPTSYHTERQKSNEDGDTDSSFSWQGSSSYLNRNDEKQ